MFTTLVVAIVFVLINTGHREWTRSTAGTTVSTPGAGVAVAAQQPVKAEAKSPSLALPERPVLGEAAGALFSSRSPEPPPSQVASVPAKPSAPPLPYRFAGRLVRNGTPQVILAKGNVAFPIMQGQTLDGTYRVEAVEETIVTLVYLPLNHRESIALRHPPQAAVGRPAASLVNRDEARLITDFGRWNQLNREERTQISDYLAQMPASPARDKLMQEYRHRVWGLER